jgi:hypothetical protein
VRLHDPRHLAAGLTYTTTWDLELTSQSLGHSSTAITEHVHTSVFEDVEREAAESAASLVPRAQRPAVTDASVPTRGARGRRRLRPSERNRRPETVGRVGLEPTTQGS